MVKATGHAHAETEEQVAQVIEVPNTKLTTGVTRHAPQRSPGPAPEPAHQEKGGVLRAVAGGVAAAAASAGCRTRRRTHWHVRGADDPGLAAPDKAVAVAGAYGVFLKVGPSEHGVTCGARDLHATTGGQ